MTDFKHRERAAQEPHVRTLERQMLDTLLRIEEKLDARFNNPADKEPAAPSLLPAPKPKSKRLLG
jgi:hypothetical protein